MLFLRTSASAILALSTALACSAPGGGPGAVEGAGASSGSGNNGNTGEGNASIDDDLISTPEPEVIPDCDNILEIVVRDFSTDHPDFGGIPYSNGQEGLFIGDGVRRTLVEDQLGANKKPIFRDPMGCAAPNLSNAVGDCADWGEIAHALTNAENFKEWYLETPGKNFVFDKEITLNDQGDGTYLFETDAFFPLSTEEGFGATVGAPSDNITAGRNYLFTTEIHLQFTYVAGQKFTFIGDDDLWVFVNGKLALDLGSMHAAAEATIDFDKQAADLGIAVNGSYSMDIFHAERRWNGSNFRIETNISCFVPVTEGIVR